MKRILLLVAGVAGLLIGLGFIMPAVALWRHEGSMPGSSVALLALGIGLSMTGVGAALRGIAQGRS
jgi:hypothetical protein